jgi:hypothetical protein
MLGRFLCLIGVHDWKEYDEKKTYTTYLRSYDTTITYECTRRVRICTRCGKKQYRYSTPYGEMWEDSREK